VIDEPWLVRQAVLRLFILPFRPRKSAEAYATVWTSDGSPLLSISRQQRDLLAQRLGSRVFLAMRYGSPSIPEVVRQIQAEGHDDVVVVPMYPHYSSAANGSSIAAVTEAFSASAFVPALKFVRPFWDHPGVLGAWEAILRENGALDADHVLFSYHGLPERQVAAAGGPNCQMQSCCTSPGAPLHACYRAQCFANTARLAERLGLKASSTSFQSRLGRTPWIKPYTDTVLDDLARDGVEKLVVVCPAFVADCLETLEEIGIRAKEQFLAAGGKDLRLVPCLDTHPLWMDALADLVRECW
jgi:ferrochelatase